MKKILITGASSGIGKKLAINLTNKANELFLLARSIDKLELLKKDLEEKNPSLKCECIKYDLSDIENLDKIIENYDIDLLINCAGFGKITDFSKLSDKEDLDTINVNFISPMLLTKKYSEKFLQKGQGIILNVCSTAALYQHPYMAIYSSTKSALLHYSLALDEELHNENKNVSFVECELFTGRTHQIRVHLKHIGHPIIGDKLYNPNGINAKRQMLHAYKLSFNHPKTRKRIDLEIPIYEDMIEFNI